MSICFFVIAYVVLLKEAKRCMKKRYENWQRGRMKEYYVPFIIVDVVVVIAFRTTVSAAFIGFVFHVFALRYVSCQQQQQHK